MKKLNKIKRKHDKKIFNEDYFNNMPSSVMFVKMMAATGTPMGLETYERALSEGGEKYFPDEFEYRRKWDLVPQGVKDAYYDDPNSGWFNAFDKDPDAPLEIQNWPGIIGATDEDWRIHREWYNSEKYKANLLLKNKLRVETYNKYFSEYGLTKTLKDFE